MQDKIITLEVLQRFYVQYYALFVNMKNTLTE